MLAVPLTFSRVALGTLYLGFSERALEINLARVRNQTVGAAAEHPRSLPAELVAR